MIETSFYELRMKSVINVIDGKNLGHICDIVLEVCSGKILGFVVPGQRRWFHIFKSCEDIFIPYHNICKIGVDTILVELSYTESKNFQNTSFYEVSCPGQSQKNNSCSNGCHTSKPNIPCVPNCPNPCKPPQQNPQTPCRTNINFCPSFCNNNIHNNSTSETIKTCEDN